MWPWWKCYAVHSVINPMFSNIAIFFLVLKIIILWEAVCITLYSQNLNSTFNIRFWIFTHGVWKAGSSEHRVIPSKLMKRGWKYPLKHQEGGEGTPLKHSQLGALSTYWTSQIRKETTQYPLDIKFLVPSAPECEHSFFRLRYCSLQPKHAY